MDQVVNAARGEVALKIGNVNLVIAAEIERLSAVSTALECKSLSDLFLRLTGTEVAATRAAIQYLTIRGDVAEALSVLKLKDFPACTDAFAATLAHHFEGEEGNDPAAKEGKQNHSLGGSGKK